MYKIILVLCFLFISNYVNGQQIDPTRPFGEIATSNSSEKGATLVLQSIIESNNKRKAIINGQALSVGDKYNGFNLIAISKNGVVLDSPQGRMELSLFSGVIANSK